MANVSGVRIQQRIVGTGADDFSRRIQQHAGEPFAQRLGLPDLEHGRIEASQVQPPTVPLQPTGVVGNHAEKRRTQRRPSPEPENHGDVVSEAHLRKQVLQRLCPSEEHGAVDIEDDDGVVLEMTWWRTLAEEIAWQG